MSLSALVPANGDYIYKPDSNTVNRFSIAKQHILFVEVRTIWVPPNLIISWSDRHLHFSL